MIELLAPAGNFDTVKPIIDSGVNAIYLGLRDFNARLRAKNFSISELESVIEYCKKKNVKVYVAFNILIKENELKKTIEYLAFLNHIKVDAVIIQDLGILNIINRYFKNLTVHASTQMFLFDQFSLQFAYDNNIKRVILPRELSYTEIKFLNDSSKIELEIFIHGSMCYSISGNCYFSNYIGKLSGNRGMCRQPCRKNFINQPFKNISKIPNSDFIQKNNIELFPYFSLNDLNLLEQIPELLKLDKLKSFKIEGRLKNTEYLLTIINAYKNVIDSYYNNTSQIFESIRHAKESLKNIQARDCSPGYYYYPDIKNIFSSGSPDLYKQAGQIKFVKGNCIYFKSETGFKITDLFKIQKFGSEKRQSLKLINLTDDSEQTINEVIPGQSVIFKASIKAGKSDLIFVLNSEAGDYQKIKIKNNDLTKNNYEILKSINAIQKKITNDLDLALKKKTRNVQEKFEYIYQKNFFSNSNTHKKPFEKNFIIELYSVNDDFDSHIIDLKIKNHNLIISIPFIIEDAESLKNRIKFFINSGINYFMLSHISQITWFKNYSQEKLFLYAGLRIPVLNSMSAYFLRELGFKGFTYSIEDDLENYSIIKSPLKKFVFIKYYPPLFTSRAENKTFENNILFDDEGKKYISFKKNNLITVIPENPVMIDYEKQFYKDNNIILIKENFPLERYD